MFAKDVTNEANETLFMLGNYNPIQFFLYKEKTLCYSLPKKKAKAWLNTR